MDLSKGREDWRDLLEHLEAERALRRVADAERIRATLDRIARWTGDTAPS